MTAVASSARKRRLRFFQVEYQDTYHGYKQQQQQQEEAEQFDDGVVIPVFTHDSMMLSRSTSSSSSSSSSTSLPRIPSLFTVVVLFCIVLSPTTSFPTTRSSSTSILPPRAVVSASFIVQRHQHRQHRQKDRQMQQQQKFQKQHQSIVQQQQFRAIATTSTDGSTNDEPSWSSSSSLLSSSFRSKTNNNNTTKSNTSSNSSSKISNNTNNRIHFLPDVERVWVLSDLHTDHVQNLQWVRDRMGTTKNDETITIAGGNDMEDDSGPNPTRRRHVFSSKDLLVIAGDISHDLELLEETFRVLLRLPEGRQDDGKDEDGMQISTNVEEDVDVADDETTSNAKNSMSTTSTTTNDDENDGNDDHSPRILFCAGNHEAWLSGSDLKKVTKSTTKHVKHEKDAGCNNDDETTTTINSLYKLDQVYEVCNKFGILTGCTCVGGAPPGETTTSKDGGNDTSHPLWIVPLESWYDGSLNIQECEDLTQDFGKWPWVDFIKCRWPKSSFPEHPVRLWRKIPYGLVEFLLEHNRRTALKDFQEAFVHYHHHHHHQSRNEDGESANNSNPSVGVMTVSHFLPNRQCLPDWKDVSSDSFDRSQWLDHGGGGISAKFALVAGTYRLDEQIRNEVLPPPPAREDSSYANVRQIHVFGHSHRPKDFELNNIRYIHNPLGKPRERDIYMVNPNVDFQLVWETSSSPPSTKTTAANTDGGGEVRGETIVRYWEEHGGGVDMLRERMKKTRRRTRYGFKHSHSHSKPNSTSKKSESGCQSDMKKNNNKSKTRDSGSSES